MLQQEIFSVVYDGNNSGMDGTIERDGVKIFKSDNTLVSVDLEQSRIAFIGGSVFVVRVGTYALQQMRFQKLL